MIKLFLEITRREKGPTKALIISCQHVFLPRKISCTRYAKSREKYKKSEENNQEFGGKSTRNYKDKHMKFFSRVQIKK